MGPEKLLEMVIHYLLHRGCSEVCSTEESMTMYIKPL
jgi:hypothetical protein